MATQGRNKPRKTGKKRTSRSLKERIKRAAEGMNREFEARNKSLGNEEFPIDESTNLYTAIPKGLYRMGKGNLKILKAGAEGLLGLEKGGQVRAMKNGGAVMKGRGPKFKGQS